MCRRVARDIGWFDDEWVWAHGLSFGWSVGHFDDEGATACTVNSGAIGHGRAAVVFEVEVGDNSLKMHEESSKSQNCVGINRRR